MDSKIKTTFRGSGKSRRRAVS